MYLNFKITHTIFIIFFIFLFGLKTNNYFDFISLSYILNKNLTNGLLIIHPLILYFSYANFLYLFFYFLNKIILFVFYGLKTNFKKTIIFYILLYIYTSIFLGSWWAEQELNWGGWWSWDLIEIISLNFFFILCFLIHLKNYLVLMYFFFLIFYLSFYYIFLLLGLIF